MSADALILSVQAALVGGDSQIERRIAALTRSECFRNIAAGYVGSEDAQERLILLVMWLDMLRTILSLEPVAKGEVRPHELVRHIKAKRLARTQHVETLRTIAASLTPKHAERLNAIADDVERDTFALRDHGIFDELASFLLELGYLGESGAGTASNPEGAWRGWIIRSLDDQLPSDMDRVPRKWATVRDLLTWAGVDGVTSYDVASIITRKRRRRS
ncbi:MAG: hypothetical protein IRZ28_22360 [Steroidobacteraceae bacterium]|nr:hypothetical protein [Steroidobacteraceae bacterium]